ncbi:MAG: helix-turn-helix domain-containing protein [Spirochaetales bacterium]|nr:helix-turn-helix domain-containing protein [Spirochaetales bacterium]
MDNDLFSDLVDSLKEVKQHQDGTINLTGNVRQRIRFKETETFDSDKIKEIRTSLHLSQSAFAEMMGTSVKTVQAWEAERNTPKGPAARLLALLKNNPEYMKTLVVH